MPSWVLGWNIYTNMCVRLCGKFLMLGKKPILYDDDECCMLLCCYRATQCSQYATVALYIYSMQCSYCFVCVLLLK